ncbi:Protein of unknown function, partial [Gryllus bimaculatus]
GERPPKPLDAAAAATPTATALALALAHAPDDAHDNPDVVPHTGGESLELRGTSYSVAAGGVVARPHRPDAEGARSGCPDAACPRAAAAAPAAADAAQGERSLAAPSPSQ